MNALRNLKAWVLLACTPAAVAASPLSLLTIAAVPATPTYVAEGVVEAVRQSALAAQVPARIVEMRVRAGDAVKAGQVLVRLDARTAQDQVASSQAQAAAAQAQLEAARRDLERNRRLYEKRYISQAALEQAETQFKAAEAQARATIAQAGVATTQSSFTTLVAPYAGVVAGVAAEVGDLANPGAPIVTLYDAGELRVVAQLPESQAQLVAPGKPVTIAIAAAGGAARTLDAAQVVMLPTANPATHTREFRLALPAAAGVAPGMFARATFPLAAGSTARITVPRTAVVRRPEFAAVYVVAADGRPQLRQVRLGREAGEGVEVVSGLVPGDRIAVDAVAAAGS